MGPRRSVWPERACELTHYGEPLFIGTLAAAYAEAGRFDDAVATAQKACALAEASGEQELLKKNQELLALYLKHQPYRDFRRLHQPDQPATNRPPDNIEHENRSWGAHPPRVWLDAPRVQPLGARSWVGTFGTILCARSFPRGRGKRHARRVRSPSQLRFSSAKLSPPPGELSFRQVKANWNRWLPVIFLAVFALSRWPGWFPPNFSAATALAFCAGVYFRGAAAWWLLLATMLVTDVALNVFYYHEAPLRLLSAAELRDLRGIDRAGQMVWTARRVFEVAAGRSGRRGDFLRRHQHAVVAAGRRPTPRPLPAGCRR